VEIPGGTGEVNVTIDYTYDPLYRLTEADYSTGEYFWYTYDAVGNRLMQETHEGLNTYVYDDANRLIDVDGTTFIWDDNGNLIQDDLRIYHYDHTNRLDFVSMEGDSYSFEYSGLGDRLKQTLNGELKSYTLNLNTGLTQVLDIGGNSYLYGMYRVAEEKPLGWEYYLGDVLGSVRTLTDASGGITAHTSYTPFGDSLKSTGYADTIFNFTGEQLDTTDLLYLRARYLDSQMGRFTTKDIWMGVPSIPLSLNRWQYVFANPINHIDPLGLIPSICHSGTINFNEFSYYRVLCGWSGRSLMININSQPWQEFASPRGKTTGLINVPDRHPLNLSEEFGVCPPLEVKKALYASDAFLDWEVNARNILTELHGVLESASSSPWALRDAIGVAYVPYNRATWNVNNPSINPHWKPHSGLSPYEMRALLISYSQFGISTAASKGWDPGLSKYVGPHAREIYEIALIVAYGVHYRYFEDTSAGATGFAHRQEVVENTSQIACGLSGPAFFYQTGYHGAAPYGRTSMELWRATGGDPALWPGGINEYPSNPPLGCYPWPK
jgi:RHS repeat-associated protein